MRAAANPVAALPTLDEFQDAFAAALLADSALGARITPAIASIAAQPGFAVYRNTVLKGCIDALEANFPAIARLVGSEWFRAAAAIYARAHLPCQPTLLYYGNDFPNFLAEFAPAREFPYLPDIARLDRYWIEAHVAPDEAPLAPASIAHLSEPALQRCTLRPHAAARWRASETLPIATIWQRNRAPQIDDVGPEIDWRGEGLLLVRPRDVVESVALDAAGCAFLDACAAGRTVLDAANAALARDAGADLSRLLADLLCAGAFAAARFIERSHGERHAERCH